MQNREALRSGLGFVCLSIDFIVTLYRRESTREVEVDAAAV